MEEARDIDGEEELELDLVEELERVEVADVIDRKLSSFFVVGILFEGREGGTGKETTGDTDSFLCTVELPVKVFNVLVVVKAVEVAIAVVELV